jgi:hypothetical protein
MKKLAIIGMFLFCLLAVLTVAVSMKNRGFTKWMTYEEMDAFWKPLEAKGDDGRNYWDRGHWLTAVEGRWHDGRPQFRLRVDGVPGERPSGWWWWFNQDEASMNRHIHEYSDKHCTLVSFNVFEWPDGTKRYSGVWHKRNKAKGDAANP